MTKYASFGAWLADVLDGRKSVVLVRASGLKENGRPVIDDSRVSKWLKDEQRPSVELASLAARVLGRDPMEALEAAGYDFADGRFRMALNSDSPDAQVIDYPAADEGVARLLLFDRNGQAVDVEDQQAFAAGIAQLLADNPAQISTILAAASQAFTRMTQGGDGDADSTEPGGSAPTKMPLSEDADTFPAAAEEGELEDPGENSI